MAYCPYCEAEFFNGKWMSEHSIDCPNHAHYSRPKIKGHHADQILQDDSQIVTEALKQSEDKKYKFMVYWDKDFPQPVPEYRFCAIATGGIGKGVRKRLANAGLPDSRFDWAWPKYKVAVEVDGNAWNTKGGGRHMQEEDLIKHGNAILLGWRVFRFTPQQLDRTGHDCAFRVLFAISEGMVKDVRRFQDEITEATKRFCNKEY